MYAAAPNLTHPRTNEPTGLNEQARESLEQLDDAVFAAVGGDLAALQQVRKLWPQALVELGWDAVEESREQYLRHAAEVTSRCRPEDTRAPQKALAANEVIALLTRF